MKTLITIKFALIFLFISSGLCAQSNSFEFDFNRHNGTYKKYTNALLNADFNGSTLTTVVGVDARGTVGNGHLRAFYPKNKISGRDTGFRFEKFMTPSKEAVLEYRVKFENDFDFSKGGKLPGLGGSETARGRAVFGCKDVRSIREKAFSTRLMWREGGKLIFYIYAPLHPAYRNSSDDIPNSARERGQGRCGGDLKITTLSKNRWYTIKQYIKLNTFDRNGNPNKNGKVKIWINGVLEFDYNNFVIAGTSKIKANSIVFHTYRGGSTNDWASSKNGYALFDDVKACTGCNDVEDSDNGNGDGDSNTNNTAPVVNITSPVDGAVYELGQTIDLAATATDNNLEKINIKINNEFYKFTPSSPATAAFNPTATGIYKIAARAVDTDGLAQEKFVTITVVEPNRAPTVVLTSPVDGAVYNLGDTIALKAEANDADGNFKNINFKVDNQFYRYSPNKNASTTFNPTAAGTYVIAARAIDDEGLAEEKSVTITVQDPALSNDIFFKDDAANKITLYPNPAFEVIHLKGAKAGTNYKIIDISGKIVYTGQIQNENSIIDISKFARGIYFLKITDEEYSGSKTFIKQ